MLFDCVYVFFFNHMCFLSVIDGGICEVISRCAVLSEVFLLSVDERFAFLSLCAFQSYPLLLVDTFYVRIECSQNAVNQALQCTRKEPLIDWQIHNR